MVSANPIVSDIVELCYQHGIRHVVLSPGSRNAPFSISFQEDERFTCYVIPDERAAAFFALGLAQKTEQMTAICCTSGTAVANYSPAIAEAYYQRIPILAITADRPEEWINQGIGQSINQVGIFNNFIRKSCQLPSDFSQRVFAARLVNEVLLCGQQNIKGPVHINVPLYEPLYDTVELPEVLPKVIQKISVPSSLSLESIEPLIHTFNQSSKKLILIGALDKNVKLQEQLDKLIDDPSVVVLTETHANLHHPRFHASIDRLIEGIDPDHLEAFTPDILITFGVNIISKKIKTLLLNMDIAHHWHIDVDPRIVDTYRSLSVSVETAPDQFFTTFLPHIKFAKSNFQNLWANREQITKKAHNSYINAAPFSDLKTFETILEVIPDHCFLQMGNSATVRYIQLFPPNQSITYHGNRGVSGIDGCTSTAAGAAWTELDNNTILISGDISFLYDVNGLFHNYLSPLFKIIIINNRGGGIFRFINGPNTTKQLESTFEARHHIHAEHVAKTYGLDYSSVDNLKDLIAVLPVFLGKSKRAQILEIFTPTEVNDVVLRQYFKTIHACTHL